jgi:hypothetical protein
MQVRSPYDAELLRCRSMGVSGTLFLSLSYSGIEGEKHYVG